MMTLTPRSGLSSTAFMGLPVRKWYLSRTGMMVWRMDMGISSTAYLKSQPSLKLSSSPYRAPPTNFAPRQFLAATHSPQWLSSSAWSPSPTSISVSSAAASVTTSGGEALLSCLCAFASAATSGPGPASAFRASYLERRGIAAVPLRTGTGVTSQGSVQQRARRRSAAASVSVFASAMAPSLADSGPDGSSPSGSDSQQVLTVGFLGLGIMGTAMARNLLKAGYQVTAWNRNPDKCQPLLAEGGKSASTPSEVTQNSDITIAMLADPEAALEVACGQYNAVGGLSTGKGYIDASTVDADSVRAIAAAVRAQGAQYLEAPVSGSKKPAEDGTLIFLAAGDKELYDRAAGILDVLGKYKVYLGKDGNGASMKLVVNMIMGSMMAAFSEGLSLGEKAGLDPKDVLDVISQGAIASPMFSMKGPSMVAGSFPPAFPLKHQQKDLRLALALGDELAQPLPVAAAANEVYKSARRQGLGDHDFSAVIETVKKSQ